MGVPAGKILQSLTAAVIGPSGSAGGEQFKSLYEMDPIILCGGIAGASYTNTLLLSSLAGNLSIRFRPMPGSSVLSAQAAQYPYANQAVAANAIIQQPLRFSMMGVCPASPESVKYLAKNAAFSGLIQSLTRHNNLGGLYGVKTPAYTYSNCLLLDVADISGEQSDQVQWAWRFDFFQPLITLDQAQQAYNSLMGALHAGTPIAGQPAWSGPGNGNPAGFAQNATGGLIAPSSTQ